MLALLAALPLLGAPSSAIVVIGDDPAAAGVLQRTIDRQAAGATDVALLPLADIASALSRSDPAIRRPATDLVYRKEVEKRLSSISKSFYDGALDKTLAEIESLFAKQDAMPNAPIQERVQLLLWRAAVYLERRDEARAQAAAREALGLVPGLVVDERSFPPSVFDLVSKVRPTMVRDRSISLQGLPRGALTWIDDRQLEGNVVKVSAGRHNLVATAAGYDAVRAQIDVETDVAIDLPLAPGIEAGAARTLLGGIRRGRPRDADAKALAAVSKAIGVRNLVVVAILSDSTIGAFHWDGETANELAKAKRTPESVASWAFTQVSGVGETRRAMHAAGFSVTTAAGLDVSSRERAVSGDGPGWATRFSGGGFRAEAIATQRAWSGIATLRWSTYELSTVNARFADGSTQTIRGGTTTAGRIGGRWRSAPEGRFAGEANAGLFVDRHEAHDLRDLGGRLGVLPTRTRMGVDVGGGVSAPVDRNASWLANAGVSIAPFSLWQEGRPRIGRTPTVLPALGWNAGLTRVGAWDLRVDYRGERAEAKFSGTANTETTSPLVDPTVTETVHVVTFSVGKRL